MNSKNKFAKLGLIFILCTIGSAIIFAALDSILFLLSFIPIINIITGIFSTILTFVAMFGGPALFILSIVFSIIGLKSEKKKLAVAALIIAGIWGCLMAIVIIVTIILAILAITGIIGLGVLAPLLEAFGMSLLPLLLV